MSLDRTMYRWSLSKSGLTAQVLYNTLDSQIPSLIKKGPQVVHIFFSGWNFGCYHRDHLHRRFSSSQANFKKDNKGDGKDIQEKTDGACGQSCCWRW